MAPSGFPPSCYIIGAQKAGTTALADALAAHPQVSVGRRKEHDYFTGNWERGVSWYRSQFEPGEDRILLDASPSYSMAPTGAVEGSRMADVPARIAALQPEARFIYLVRDPVDRSISAYWHAVRTGEESRPIEDCLVEESLYVRASRYAFQLRHYFQFFPQDRFLVLASRQLASDASTTVADCLMFLGLDPGGLGELKVARRNEGYIPKGPVGAVLQSRLGKHLAKSAWRVVRGVLPERTLGAIKSGLSRPPPEVPDRVRQRLDEMLGDERRQLFELTGVQL